MARKSKYASKTILPNESGIQFNWSDAVTTKVMVEDFSPQIQKLLLLYGISQKLGDSYSSASTLAEAKGLFNKTLDSLLRGDWSTRGESTGSALLFQAIANVMQRPVEVIAAQLSTMPPERRKAIVSHPDIRKEVKRLELEAMEARNASADAVDLSDLFE